MNLNIEECYNDDPSSKLCFEDNSIYSGTTAVHFRKLDEKLIDLIDSAQAVLGAVAWLSNYDILDAMSKKEHVSIVVQKEDFLRPDVGRKSNFGAELRRKYKKLKAHDYIARCSMTGTIGSSLSVCGEPTMETVRCAGNHNSEKSPCHPRMHNKFILLCDIINGEHENSFSEFKPWGVWTGSFNFSYSATQSLENAVVMTDEKIVHAYYKEFAQIYGISETLDWENPWCSPEYRIGT